MGEIIIRPDRLRQLGAPDGATFCLVTNRRFAGVLRVETRAGRAAHRLVVLEPDTRFECLLEREIPEPAHVLVISPDVLFRSPDEQQLGRRKLVAMPCYSTPTSLEAIAHFLGVIERTDPDEQAATAERFFASVAPRRRLRLVHPLTGTTATLELRHEQYEWHQQLGPLDWGEQQVAPAGEISVFPAGVMAFEPHRRFVLDGELTLSGPSILHAGAASFSRDDQARIHAAVATLAAAPAVARVSGGVITELEPCQPAAVPAVAMLEALFAADARYRVVWELGFGIHRGLTRFPGNTGMNETYGGDGGGVHLGLGLTPDTQYALIQPCDGTEVEGEDGTWLIGAPRAGMAPRPIRRGTGACRCLEGSRA